MQTKTHIHMTKALERPMTPTSYRDWLWSLAEAEDCLHPETVGSTASGHTIYAISIGEGPAVVYVGGLYRGDWLSTATLLGFLAEYSRLWRGGEYLYRIHLPQLFTHRRICVIPAVNIEGLGEVPSDSCTNGLGADIADYFAQPLDNGIAPERTPEATALMQYLRYQEPAMLCTVRGNGSGGITVPIQPSPRAGTTGRLLAGMVHLPVAEGEDKVASWYGGESGQPSYGISLGLTAGEDAYHQAYATIRELLYSAPLLL